MRYSIAGLIIDIDHDFQKYNNDFDSFLINTMADSDARVGIEACDRIKKPDGLAFIYEENTSWYRNNKEENSFTVYCHHPQNPEQLVCRFDIYDWNLVIVKYLRRYIDMGYMVMTTLMQIFFRHLIILHSGILLHASAILWNNNGILFSAPSGTGKSTQARLWEKYYNARVINDDAPALRFIDDKVMAYGTPWSGSSNKYLNVSAPVAAIYVLQQSPNNEIRKLTSSEITTLLLPRFLLPYYHDHLMDRAVNTVNNIISSIPVYLLKCKPDREAVELAHRYVV